MAELMRYAQLVKGGKTIKQGEIFELAFQLFGSDNVITVPTVDQTIAITIANNSGTVYETTAVVVDNKIQFTVSENIGYGQMRLEIKVTEGTTLIQKYPADGWIILNITKSLDDANVGGINAVTATQMRSEITALETSVGVALADAVEAKTLSLDTQTQLDTIIIDSGTSDAETIQARGGEPLLYNRLDGIDLTVADNANEKGVNVKRYGAKGNMSDDTLAVLAAWDVAVAGFMKLYFPKGNYNVDSTQLSQIDPTRLIFENGAKLYDSLSGAYATPSFIDPSSVDYLTPYKTQYDRVIRARSPKVVAYGDSNTRFYQGDTGTSGPDSNSYARIAEVLSIRHYNIMGATFVTKGFPSQTSAYGLTNFDAQVGAETPNAVVLGFGTNNVKSVGANVVTYIADMEAMIKKILALNALPILLTIPDYVDTYAAEGVLARHRIKVWNMELVNLCKKYSVPYIDVYTMFNNFKANEASTWYNEATSWRHYSKEATTLIAHKLCSVLSEYSIHPKYQSDYLYGFPNGLRNVSIEKATLVTYALDTFNFNAIQMVSTGINSPSKVKFYVLGAVNLGFYPRTNSGIVNIKISEATGGTVRNETFDTYGGLTDGKFSPIKKYQYDGGDNRIYFVEIESTGTKNVDSTGTDAFLVSIASAKILSGNKQKTTGQFDAAIIAPLMNGTGDNIYSTLNDIVYVKKFDGGAIATQTIKSGTVRPTNANYPIGYCYFDTTLGKPIWNNGTGWVDSTGVVV